MSEKTFNHRQIAEACSRAGLGIDSKLSIAAELEALDEKQPTFEEKWREIHHYWYPGDTKDKQAQLIASYVSSEIDKLRREIGEGK